MSIPMTAEQSKLLNALLRATTLAALRAGHPAPRTSDLLGQLWTQLPPADGRCWNAFEADEVIALARAVLRRLRARTADAPRRDPSTAQAGS